MLFKGILLAQTLTLIGFKIIMNDVKLPKFKNYTGQKVNFIQPKLDGHFTKVVRNSNFSFTITSKNDKDITKKVQAIKHIENELIAMPPNSCIMAELHCPGVFATNVPTMLNEANEKLMLTVFAVPWLDGENWSEQNLIDIMLKMDILGFDIALPTSCTYISQGFVNKKNKKILLERAIKNKFEGFVLKESHMTGWYKLKPVKTIDAVVIGTFKSFSTTHYGCLQGLQIIVYKQDGKAHFLGQVGSGFKLEYRKTLDTQEKRDALIGRVCECAYDSIAAKGALRFPRFLRWRDDKDPKQCTTEQF